MRDYLNANEKNQFMVIISVLQSIEGKRNMGISGPTMNSMREDWSSRDNMSKEEHRYLKTAETYLQKFIESVFNRLSQKDQDIIRKKVVKYDFRLIDDFTLKQVFRDISDRMVNAAVPREQFEDWCEQIMNVKCNGCTIDWNTCKLYQIFDDNFIPESGFNCQSCKYAYTLEDKQHENK